jgi:hypothetical protein
MVGALGKTAANLLVSKREKKREEGIRMPIPFQRLAPMTYHRHFRSKF